MVLVALVESLCSNVERCRRLAVVVVVVVLTWVLKTQSSCDVV
jgi:hypothetical protein